VCRLGFNSGPSKGAGFVTCSKSLVEALRNCISLVVRNVCSPEIVVMKAKKAHSFRKKCRQICAHLVLSQSPAHLTSYATNCEGDSWIGITLIGL